MILCFTAASEGDALKELVYWGAAPLKRQASGIAVLNMLDKEDRAQLPALLEKPLWFAMSHFGIGQDFTISRNGKEFNLWEYFGIPFLRVYGDLPAYFPDRHVRRFRNTINNYYDRSQVEFYKRWFRNGAICSVLPPVIYNPLPLDEVDVQAKLAGKIVFPKNGNSPDQLIDYWRSSLPRSLAACLESIAEECTAKDQINRMPVLDERVLAHYRNRGIDLEADPMIVCFLVAQIDDFIRRVKSTLIVRAIMDLPVVIRGRFWEHLDFHGKRAVLDPDSDYSRTAPVIDRAPAVIDMSPNTLATPHDRICRAAGRGTAFLTNRQDFLDVFERPGSFSFDFEVESIRACVEYHVEHPQQAVELGFEQARIFRQAYPEEKYAEALRSVIQLAAFRMGERPPGTQNYVDFPSQLI